ncbi:MAG: hypothetical protein HPY66_2174 [Firmicutes bacterium]|nr:hypothetical protein [Bacillota bacterium]MDI6706749.1 Spo0E family sporulation regulatory protein-aspartic acid phosphatase [Bacillota bacterium]
MDELRDKINMLKRQITLEINKDIENLNRKRLLTLSKELDELINQYFAATKKGQGKGDE